MRGRSEQAGCSPGQAVRGIDHASSDRRRAHRPRHQVDRACRLGPRARRLDRASPASSSTSRTTRRRPGSRPAPSRPVPSTSWRPSRTRTTSRPWWSTSATAGSPPTTWPRSRAQVTELQDLDGVVGEAVGPIPSEDGEVAQTIVTFNFGKNGWNALPDAADEIRDIATIDGVTVHLAGAGGQAADSAEAFAGIDGTLLLREPGRRHPDPAAHLPQPGALGAADPLGRVRAVHQRGASSTSSPSTPTSPSTARARRSSPCWSSAPAPTTRCSWWPATARSCAGTRTGTRRWPSRCTAPPRRSSPAPAPSSPACSA